MRTYSDGNQVRKKVKKITEIVASYCEKSLPTEKAKEHFKRKAYEKMNNQNTCKDTECPFFCEKQDCVAKEGCAGYTTEEKTSWKQRMMQRFEKVD